MYSYLGTNAPEPSNSPRVTDSNSSVTQEGSVNQLITDTTAESSPVRQNNGEGTPLVVFNTNINGI